MSWNEDDEDRKTAKKANYKGFDISEDPTGKGAENLNVLGRIDQYELLKELGTGGFGSVYLARDTVSRTFVAVKGLPALVKNNAEEMERIQENFALVSRLHHPNIAAALVLHPANKVSYSDPTAAEKLNVKSGNTLMVMEYAPGVTLTKWRRQFPERKVPLDKAIEIVRQVAAAMDYAHQRKIIHRDIKPSNVMVETYEDGTFTARVLDFGLAAEVRSSMNRVSKEVSSKSGTRQYMAPEQWAGKKQGAATDQYSLAVLFYELVTGDIPFASAFECDDPIVMMTAVTTQEVEIPKEYPKFVRRSLRRAFSKNPESRFKKCVDFCDALRGISHFHWRKVCLGVLCITLVAAIGFALQWYVTFKRDEAKLLQELDVLEVKAGQAHEKVSRENFAARPELMMACQKLEAAYQAGQKARERGDYLAAKMRFLDVRDLAYNIRSNLAIVAKSAPRQKDAVETNTTAVAIAKMPLPEQQSKQEEKCVRLPFAQIVKSMPEWTLEDVRRNVTKDNPYLGEVDTLGNSLLHIAAMCCRHEVLEYLVSVGYDLKLANTKNGETPIFAACAANKDEIALDNLSWLVAKGAKVNARNPMAGDSIVPYPIFRVHSLKVFEQLIALGADWKVTGSYGKSILHSAVTSGDVAFAERCLQLVGDVNVRDDNGSAPIHDVAKTDVENKTDIMRLLLDKGADVNCRVSKGYEEGATPLHFAVMYPPSKVHEGQTVEVIRYLIAKGADVESEGKGLLVSGCRPLHLAAWHGNVIALKELIRAGANVKSVVAGSGLMGDYTALHVAAKWCNKGLDEVLGILKDYELDVNTRIKGDGLSPLDVVVKHKIGSDREGAIKLFIENGATSETIGIAMMNACFEGNVECVRSILKYHPQSAKFSIQGVSPIPVICKDLGLYGGQKVEILKELVASGGEVDPVIDVGEGKKRKRFSALHLLAKQDGSNVVSAIRLLIKNGARKDRESVGFHDSISTPLGVAVYENKMENVRAFVELGCNVQERSDEGFTMLHEHVRGWGESDPEIIKALISGGLDVDSRIPNGTYSGYTALSFAAADGDCAGVKALLENGADVNAKDNSERTPILLLVNNNTITEKHLDCLEILVAHGADLNVKDKWGGSLLENAKDAKMKKKIKECKEKASDDAIIKANAGLGDGKNKGSEKAKIELARILSNGDVSNVERAEILIKDGVQVTVVNSDGLLTFADSGSAPVVAYMIEHGADVNVMDGNGKTALMRVVDKAREKKGVDETMIDVLLAHGALVNVHKEDSFSMIATAWIYDQHNVCRKLIVGLVNNHEDVNRDQEPLEKKRPGTSSPPLYYAATKLRDLALTKLLVEAGAKVEFKCRNNFYFGSLLQTVAYELGNPGNGCLPIIKYLISKGADAGYMDQCGANLLAYAVMSGDIDMVKYCVEELRQDVNNITDYGARKNRDDKYSIMLHAVSAHTNSLMVVKYLESKGAGFNLKNGRGFSFAHECAHSQSQDAASLMKYLVKKGLPIDEPNMYGRTPLMSVERYDVLKVLIDLGANVNARDKDGQTPIFHVGYHEGVYAKTLIAAGADVNARDKSGKTPIFEARTPGAIDALLDAGANINARDNDGKTAYEKCWSDETKAYLKSKGATD